MVKVTVRFENLTGKPTIYSVLKEKFGREPTNQELKAEISRILEEFTVRRSEAGKLSWQRKR
jgi:hypothetical protein